MKVLHWWICQHFGKQFITWPTMHKLSHCTHGKAFSHPLFLLTLWRKPDSARRAVFMETAWPEALPPAPSQHLGGWLQENSQEMLWKVFWICKTALLISEQLPCNYTFHISSLMKFSYLGRVRKEKGSNNKTKWIREKKRKIAETGNPISSLWIANIAGITKQKVGFLFIPYRYYITVFISSLVHTPAEKMISFLSLFTGIKFSISFSC